MDEEGYNSRSKSYLKESSRRRNHTTVENIKEQYPEARSAKRTRKI